MRIFAMNDCDWMAAETLEEAKAEYVRNYGGDEHSIENPHELDAEAMDRMRLHDEDEGQPDCSFREGLARMVAQGVQFPTFFASTEY